MFCPLRAPFPYAGGPPKRSIPLTDSEIHKRAAGFNSLGTAHAESAMSRANLARFAENVRPLYPPWAAIPGNAAARLMVVFFAFFTHAVTPPFAARFT